jgi:hypothetical protein
LLNEINTSGGRALPEGNSSMREEVVPLQGIKLILNIQGIKRVHLEPERQNLKFKKTAAGIEVIVPTLKLHSMVVIETQK